MATHAGLHELRRARFPPYTPDANAIPPVAVSVPASWARDTRAAASKQNPSSTHTDECQAPST
jgi:hypothetical protein